MEGVKVKINGISYEMLFNLNLFRQLGKHWNLPDLPSTAQKIAKIETLDSGNFEAYDVLFDVLYYSIACNKSNPEIDKKDLENISFAELGALSGQLISGITEAFPQPEANPDTEKKLPAPKKPKPGTT